MQTEVLAGFLDELVKIGARRSMANWMQARKGTRPIRVHNLLNKSQTSTNPDQLVSQGPDPEGSPNEQLSQEESPDATQEGIGKHAGERTEKAMGAFAKARPYVAGGLKAGIPAALMGKIMAGEGAKGRHTARILGLLGTGAGVANEALKDWAQKHRRKRVAKELLGNAG